MQPREELILNAKNHEAEAAVAEAGRPGHVTVSTQMAGRGTDIKLGGKDECSRDAAVEAGDCTWSAWVGSAPAPDNQLAGVLPPGRPRSGFRPLRTT